MNKSSLFITSLSVSLIMAFSTNSIGYAREASAPLLDSNCGEWKVEIANSTEDQRLGIALLKQAIQADCNGVFTLSNETGTFLGGGYSLKLNTSTDNASTEFLPYGKPILVPGLNIEIKATPGDVNKQSRVVVLGDFTLGTYLAVDISSFLLKSALEFVPGGQCFISLEQIGLVSLRLAPILGETAKLALNGDFVESKEELSRVINVFYEKAGEILTEIGISCGIEVAKLFVKVPVVTTKIILNYLTFIPVAIFDYFKYQGWDISVTLSYTPSNTPQPVSSLDGTVLERSQCRYGPSQYHLFKTGFKPQAPVEVIGRDADGDWLHIQLRGRNEPCWINGKLVQVDGDVMALPDDYPFNTGLPISDDFEQITIIAISPGGNGFTVEWLPHTIRIDLVEEGVVKYIVEVWTCADGKTAFYAVGTDDTFATIQIDNSCGIASHADVIGQDQHGFSPPATVSLP